MSDDGREFDNKVSEFLADFARRSTRRDIISRIGRILLVITGVTLYPLLPVDRMVPKTEANGPCDDYTSCGMCGRSCYCTGCSNDGTCPSGCPASWRWLFCCWDAQMANYFQFAYWDCCETGSNCTGCNDTNCPWCRKNCPQGIWCINNTLIYRCTTIVKTGVICPS